MTCDRSPAPGRQPGWYVVTAQGVILSGPHTRRETADIAFDDTVTALRHELERSRKPEDFVAVQLAAVTVAYGVQVGAWNGFQRREEPGGCADDR